MVGLPVCSHISMPSLLCFHWEASAQGIAVEYHSPSFLFAAQLFRVTYFISFVETFYIYQHATEVLLGKKKNKK